MVVRSTDFPANAIPNAIASAQQQQQQQHQKDGLKPMCSTTSSSNHSFHHTVTDKQADIVHNNNTNNCNLNVRALTSITTTPQLNNNNNSSSKKVERKTAKVAPLAPISRKSNAPTKKLLPKKIAPRTPANVTLASIVDAIKPQRGGMRPNFATQHHQTSMGDTAKLIAPAPANIQMLAAAKRNNDLMQQQKQLMQKMTQPTVLLTTIRVGQHIALQQSQNPNVAVTAQQQQQQPMPQQQTQQTQQAQTIQAHKNMVQQATVAQQKQQQTVNKMNGPIYQLHPAPVMPKLVQIPVATKEATTPTANNLVVNNGAHYFFNGAVIKLQQMTQQVSILRYINVRFVSRIISRLHQFAKLSSLNVKMRFVKLNCVNLMFLFLFKSTPTLTDQQIQLSQKPNFAQQAAAAATKLSGPPHLIQDAQSLQNHNDLTQHFVTTSTTGGQFAQPVLIPTSSGLLLTAYAVSTDSDKVLTSHIPNLQPLSQQQMPALHQFNQPNTANIPTNLHAANFLSTHNGLFSVTATAAVTTNQSPQLTQLHPKASAAPILSSIPMTSKTTKSTILPPPALAVTLPALAPATQQPIANTHLHRSDEILVRAATKSSSPPPLCVQSKDLKSVQVNQL